MGCEEEMLVQQVTELYDQISNLKSLKPSEAVNTLFTKLVVTCMPPSPIDVAKLGKSASEMRSKLIRLCGEAEGLLESHYGAVLGTREHPLDHLNLFPYYNNYLKLSRLEHTLMTQHSNNPDPCLVSFVGSGPLPLSSIVLASNHLPAASFHNYDMDPSANSIASALVSAHPDLSKRMSFHTADIMDVTAALKDYDVVFLAALVGMDEDKLRVVDHLANYMAPGAILMVRSAHGARAFLYPVIDPCDLRGFEVLSVFHPADDVINSVVVARKHTQPLVLPTKCSEIQAFNPLNSHANIIEEFAFEDPALLCDL